MKEIRPEQFLLLMFISLIVSLFISYLYLTFYKNRATGSQIHRAFPLLGVSITALFISIQFSLPLSLGLLGALSIVRFRTPIKEPEEIGFIMLVVAASICCATFNLFFLGILLLIAFIGLILINKGPRIFQGRLNDGIILITMPTTEFKKIKANILDYLEEKLPKGKIESILENNDESVLSYSFLHLEKDTVIALQTELQDMTKK
ncbi:MAG: DUF4956 domain-containing protein, partial [Deltaproteobacteria bacterium]|nr:DUF4956 domain-containing protein [Deltaproteobacteria bacterium]